jgi:hypothetical protein
MVLVSQQPEALTGEPAWLQLATLAPRQPLLTRFTLGALAQQRLAHAFLLKGRDVEAAYQWFLALAATLNCQQPLPTATPGVMQPCGQCQHCLWISRNAHPHVITLTRHTYPTPDDDKSKRTERKELSTDQISQLMHELSYLNDTWRFVWLGDSQRVPKRLAPVTPYPMPVDGQPKPDVSLRLTPLTQRVMSDKATNQLLKTLEAPPPRTVFVFYTDSEQSVLPTIVSRCQVLPLLAPPNPLLAGASPPERALQRWGVSAEHHAWLQGFWSRWLTEAAVDPFALIDDTTAYWETEQQLAWPQVMAIWQAWFAAQWEAQQVELTPQRYVQLQRKLRIAQRWFEQKTHSQATLWWVLAAPLSRQTWG